MGSYEGSSDWDEMPAPASFEAFKPEPARPATGRQQQAASGPAAAAASGASEEGELDIAARTGPKKRLNAIIAFDTTGSMTPYVENVQAKIEYLATGLLKLLDAEIALVGIGDHGDGKRMLQINLFSRDLEELRTNVRSLQPTEGGDTPEAFECLFKVLNTLDYAVPTVLILVTDSIPHGMEGYEGDDDGCPFDVDYAEELEELRGRLKNVYLVSCAEDEKMAALQRRLVGDNSFLKLPNIFRLTNLVMAVCMDEVGELDYFMSLLERQRGPARRQEILQMLGRAS